MKDRKNPRLRGYDYKSNGMYFITICTKNRAAKLSRIFVGRDDLGAPCTTLLPAGLTLERLIRETPMHYSGVDITHFVIMPNHVHVLLSVTDGAPGSSRPTISQIIGLWKRMTNKAIGESIFQASFHDHIIRDEHDFLAHWQYIDDNPAKWTEDEYYCE